MFALDLNKEMTGKFDKNHFQWSLRWEEEGRDSNFFFLNEKKSGRSNIMLKSRECRSLVRSTVARVKVSLSLRVFNQLNKSQTEYRRRPHKDMKTVRSASLRPSSENRYQKDKG